MLIIPAIDIISGRCVRLSQGDYDRCKVYSENPLDIAQQFENAGCKRLHLVDLDGAKSAGVVNLAVLREICRGTSLSVDFGGGVKSDADVQQVLDAGADFICVGSMAQTHPQKVREWMDVYGGNRFIIGADVLNEKICINGWKTVTETHITDFINEYGDKINYLLCTDISKDGMLAGASVALYKKLQAAYPSLNIIASGGVSGVDDLTELARAGLYAAVVGKAIYENKISLNELAQMNTN
jgi:phosphoribosylformimino-5-aminoimidazole carboxamide ribotide isomerase